MFGDAPECVGDLPSSRSSNSALVHDAETLGSASNNKANDFDLLKPPTGGKPVNNALVNSLSVQHLPWVES